MENKGVANRIMQKLIKKPKTSYIHLDEMGSFIWPLMDGEKDILEIGKYVEEHFGEKAEPLYNELIECCTFIPDGNANGAGIGCTQDTIDAQIIDPMNLYKLRMASAKLNFGFFMNVLQSQDPKANTITFSKTSHK
jgi:hypothetical protein